ncbi:heterokaryon incompatibility protein-domain-containing protein [Dactylonectria macrodidyma]|uniref:Heterokaryon incompatibility protein-domain-containing protein n=1 Tax=Dactylonectria macrodidyma TaxID=307937 RepID=A0A9P9DJA2_9HYPO|nr:heterokaryon incompatibility protein-domain-containing protein [Dactylonectria macrodidyma]
MNFVGDQDCFTCSARRQERWSGVSQLQTDADDGCPYCSLLNQGLLRLDPDVAARLGEDAVIRFKNPNDMIVYADSNGPLGHRPDLKDVDFQYEFYKEGDSRPYKPTGDTSSDVSYGRMYWWIRTCSEEHPLCGNGEPAELPTRILYLGEDLEGPPTDVKLVEPSPDQKDRYIALSHCWGEDQQPLLTTTATLEDHKAGILFDQLPKTFQDVVKVSRRLGVRYLWIDSLCIIQDSAEDWEMEASSMAAVYRNSWVTVAGTCSSSSSSGCYRSDQGVNVQAPAADGDDPLAVLFPAATKLRQEIRLNLRFKFQHPEKGRFSYQHTVQPFPLLTRAWVYQERLLSPRVLHFGPQEVFWECMQDVDCECGSMKWSNAQNMGGYMNRDTSNELPDKISHYAALHIGKTSARVDDTKRKEKLLSRWADMVGDYTSRALTFPTDRLPALSGIAAEMVDALGMKYCAGLWEETLPLGLLWERQDSGDVPPFVTEPRVAPSWSWATLNCPVRFLLPLYGPYRKWEVPELFAGVEEVQCVPVGKDERGQVLFGESYITLSAEVVEASLGFEVGSSRKPWMLVSKAIEKGMNVPEKGLFMAKPGKETPVQFWPDHRLGDAEGNWRWRKDEKLYCAKILRSAESFYWLALRRVSEEEPTYERVGVIANTEATWETDGVKQHVKII